MMKEYGNYKNNCYDNGCDDKKEYCYKKQFCKMEPVWYEKTCKCEIEKIHHYPG